MKTKITIFAFMLGLLGCVPALAAPTAGGTQAQPATETPAQANPQTSQNDDQMNRIAPGASSTNINPAITNGSNGFGNNGAANENGSNGMTNGINGNPYANYTNPYANYTNPYWSAGNTNSALNTNGLNFGNNGATNLNNMNGLTNGNSSASPNSSNVSTNHHWWKWW